MNFPNYNGATNYYGGYQQYPQIPYNNNFQGNNFNQPLSQQNASAQQFNLQVPNTLNGKIVESKDIVSVTEIPLGGYGLFPKADLSEIYVKVWNNSGTTETLTFKPVAKENVVNQENTMNVILEKINALENKINSLLPISSSKEPKQEIQEIRKEVSANAY